MDKHSYIEDRAADTLKVLRQSYDDLHERAYKFATVLVAGGGAVGAYAIGKVGVGVPVIAWAPLAALALSWFAIAAQLVWTGATSRELSPGNNPGIMLGYYNDRLTDGWKEDGALNCLRDAELDLQTERIRNYSYGCTTRAESIDRAYKTAALATPLVPSSVVALAAWLNLF